MLKKKLIRSSLFGYGCLILLPNPNEHRNQPVKQPASVLVAADQEANRLSGDSVEPVKLMLPLRKTTAAPAPAIPLNKQAVRFTNSFIKREEEFLTKTRARSATYFRIIDNVFQKYELPVELRYLAVVESDLKPDARSRMGARGLWQLMPETGRDYGLKVGGGMDERTHSYKSTVAAAKYIKGLYQVFGDWLLVIAAYNGGEGSVKRAIKRSGSRNFWALQNYLPAESRAHVKRYIGTMLFFEGKTGITTLTKNELNSYLKAKAEFEATIATADSLTASK